MRNWVAAEICVGRKGSGAFVANLVSCAVVVMREEDEGDEEEDKAVAWPRPISLDGLLLLFPSISFAFTPAPVVFS